MSEIQYYLVLDGKNRVGPFPRSQVLSMLGTGVVTPETPAWVRGMPAWARIKDFGLVADDSDRPTYSDDDDDEDQDEEEETLDEPTVADLQEDLKTTRNRLWEIEEQLEALGPGPLSIHDEMLKQRLEREKQELMGDRRSALESVVFEGGICPECQYMNIGKVDFCESCGAQLTRG